MRMRRQGQGQVLLRPSRRGRQSAGRAAPWASVSGAGDGGRWDWDARAEEAGVGPLRAPGHDEVLHCRGCRKLACSTVERRGRSAEQGQGQGHGEYGYSVIGRSAVQRTGARTVRTGSGRHTAYGIRHTVQAQRVDMTGQRRDDGGQERDG